MLRIEARLQAIFPTGVCDNSQRGMYREAFAGP
jgi:hypothetical protein